MLFAAGRPNRRLRHPEQLRPFNRWVNRLSRGPLDPVRYQMLWSDLDAVVMHNTRCATPKELWVYLLEVKTSLHATLTPSNKAALALLDAALRRVHNEIVRLPMWYTIESRRVIYLGCYILRVDTPFPRKASIMRWSAWDGTRETDGALVDRLSVVRLLRFELDPTDPARRLAARSPHNVAPTRAS
jgi:hypothetical protein